jgi:hypothetical protein
MRHKFIRTSLLVACAGFAISNANAMEEDRPNPSGYANPQSFQLSLQNQWNIKELKDDYGYGKNFSKSMHITPSEHNENSISEIFIGRATESDNFYLTVYNNIIHNMILKINSDLKSNNSLFEYTGYSYSATHTDSVMPGKFLSVFYNKDLINDFVIDRIVQHIGIEDFRMNTDRMIAHINEHMNEESTSADFKRIAFEGLAKIKDPVRRAEITWGLVQNLLGSEEKLSENFDRHLIIDLCDQITDKNFPFYSDVQILSSELAYTDDSLEQISVRDRYKKSMISLADATTTPEGQKIYETFGIKYVTHGDLRHDSAGEVKDLAEELKGLTFSPESMFDLLDIIRRQNIALHKRGDKK